MEIVRDRFLDESRSYHVTLGLRSRTTEMHSALSALTADEREHVGRALVGALDEIERVIRKHVGEVGAGGAGKAGGAGR